MKIEVSRNELLQALAAADGIAKSNPTTPLLECVLISAADRVVRVEATDLAMTITAEIKSSTTKAGSIAMPAKRLRDVVRNAPDGSVTITTLDNAWIEIKCGAAKYKLAGVTAKDFPKIPKPAGKTTTAKFDGEQIKTLIDRVLFSASDDTSRMHLNGAHFAAKDGTASMVTTDGHRLSRATCPSDATFSVIVPKEALAKMAKLLGGEVEITIDAARIFVQSGAIVMSAGLIAGEFPPIEQVIPTKFTHEVIVDRSQLIASIERTKITTTETRGMLIDGKADRLVLASSNPDVGEVSDEVTAEGADGRFLVCVAPKYLIDPLARISDDSVRLKFADSLSPLVIEAATTTDYLAIVMPMRRD